MRSISYLTALVVATPCAIHGQQSLESHRPAAEKLITAALHDSAAYNRLARLTDGFGARPSGSQNLERALDWLVAEMKKDGLENVHTEPVMVTHWVRGDESAFMETPRRVRLHILGLGRSVGTPRGGLSAPVLVVRDFSRPVPRLRS